MRERQHSTATTRWRRSRSFGAAALTAATLALGSAGTFSAGVAHAASSGNVIFALPPAVVPNYIFPIMSGTYYSNVNLYQFQALMYRPLYWFGQGTQPSFNESLSLANAPVYTNGGKTVTISMKKYAWGDGKPVTSEDVIFFMQMLKAETSIWPVYVPGEFPDNVVSMSAPNASTVVFHLDKAYSQTWFLYNELSQITPLPQHAWDKESAAGAVGNYTATPAGAKAVFNYITKQAQNPSAYATNPMWAVVDGPFKLKTFDSTTGTTVFVPNAKYSGPVKASYSSLTLEPFTTDTAEFNALRSGAVTYGYTPPQDSSQIPVIASQGYTSSPWIGWSINYFPMNFNNPTVGSIFRQLYFRQAFQELVNQPVDIKKALYGYGYPTYGPVPIQPKNNLSTPQEANNPYPYNPAKSVALLRAHGWSVQPGGTTTCAKPGSAMGDCGTGITKGEKMVFNLQYNNGFTYVSQFMQQMKSDLAKYDGIQLNLTTAPFNTVLANAVPCKGKTCTWQMENWGQGWSYGPDYYPTGESIFETGSNINEGSYSNPVNDANINATHVVSSTSALYKYENYLALQLPDVWQPDPDFQISEISNKLSGVSQSSLLNFTPEFWKLHS
ncbi:MAG: ABC transporter substrate-binding protein [Acidimicrobiaceae bacterium]|nr:ABC transporter substrate-binding protein [Acidimicrobiaceae bacterium]